MINTAFQSVRVLGSKKKRAKTVFGHINCFSVLAIPLIVFRLKHWAEGSGPMLGVVLGGKHAQGNESLQIL